MSPSVLNLKLCFIIPVPNTVYCSVAKMYKVTFLLGKSYRETYIEQSDREYTVVF